VVRITNKELASAISDEARTIIEMFSEKGKPKDEIFKECKSLNKYLGCVTNPKTGAIIYALSKLTVTSPHELRKFLGASSHTVIEHQLMKLLNKGFVSAITKANPLHDTYYRFWMRMYPTTNKRATLYEASEDTKAIADLFKKRLSEPFSEKTLKRMSSRGISFRRMLEADRNRKEKRDAEREEYAVGVMGACAQCGIVISKDDQDGGKVKRFNKKIYHKLCLDKKLKEM